MPSPSEIRSPLPTIPPQLQRVQLSPAGCWVWQGSFFPNGYGQIWWEGRGTCAHRASYEFFVGPIPEGFQVDHLCRTPACINPAHLDAVTPSENVQRGTNGRLKTHCANGHPWVAGNIRTVRTTGARYCYHCHATAARAFRARKRVAS